MATIAAPISVSRESKILKLLSYAALFVLALGGVASLLIRLGLGMKVTALTSTVAWGAWVAIYIYFIGLSAGSFLLSALIYVFGMHRYEKVGRLALVSALFALLGGMLFIWMDLGHPERFWRVFANWNITSVLAWEVLLYLLYAAIILAELWLLMRYDLAALAIENTGWRGLLYRSLALGFRPPKDHTESEAMQERGRKIIKRLGIFGVPVAIGVHGGTGAIFAVVAAKPYWFSGLFPIIFIVSALASGAALMTFLYAFFGKRDEQHKNTVRGLANLMVLFLGIDLLLLASEYLVGLYGRIPEEIEVYRYIMFGPFWYTFWIGQLLLGAVLPILIVALPRTSKSTRWLGAAGLSAVLGIVAVRINLVIPAYVVPVLNGLNRAYLDKRWSYAYFPSPLEWAASIGLVALLVLGFSFAFELLPMFAKEPESN